MYNKDYKLTSLLTPEVNYQTLEEYLTFEQSLLGSTDSVKSIYKSLVDRSKISYFERKWLY